MKDFFTNLDNQRTIAIKKEGKNTGSPLNKRYEDENRITNAVFERKWGTKEIIEISVLEALLLHLAHLIRKKTRNAKSQPLGK